MSIRVKRPSGVAWRRKMYAAVIERDGAKCGDCLTSEKIVWRNMGQRAGDLWGSDLWERHIFHMVHPCTNLELDHKTPLSEGGDNEIYNLWLLCIDCHKKKTTSERSSRLKRIFAEARA